MIEGKEIGSQGKVGLRNGTIFYNNFKILFSHLKQNLISQHTFPLIYILNFINERENKKKKYRNLNQYTS